MKLILVRHPETVANTQNIIYGRIDSHYSERGFKTAEWDVKMLREKKIDRVYTSPLWRASWLANEIAKDHNLSEPVADDRLMELNFGKFEGLTNAEAHEMYGDGFEKFWSDLAHFRAPEGESWLDVQARVIAFLEDLLAPEIEQQKANGKGWTPLTMNRPREASNDTVCIVAHALVIRSAIAWFLGFEDLNDGWSIDLRTGGIAEIVFDAERPRLFGLYYPTV